MRRVLAGVACAVILGACGGDGTTTEVSAELLQSVDAVRAAAQSGDADGALAALGDLSSLVEAGRASGTISEEQADDIGGAMADVMRALPQVSEAPPVTEAPPDTVAEDEDSDDEGDGRGKKKGHGD
jgi:hypothetical protein